jgi:hypothetical protein
MHAAAAQLRQDRGGLLARAAGLIGCVNEPTLRIAVLHGKRNLQVAFVKAVEIVGAADQDVRHISLLYEFRGAHDAMAVIIAGQHHRDLRAGGALVAHQQFCRGPPATRNAWQPPAPGPRRDKRWILGKEKRGAPRTISRPPNSSDRDGRRSSAVDRAVRPPPRPPAAASGSGAAGLAGGLRRAPGLHPSTGGMECRR